MQVFWKGEKKVVTDTREVSIVESFEEDFSRAEPETVAVGENGKIWVQGKIVGGIIVAGEPACVELQVKNHSTRRVCFQNYLRKPTNIYPEHGTNSVALTYFTSGQWWLGQETTTANCR